MPKIRRQMVFSSTAPTEQILDVAERVLTEMKARPRRIDTKVVGRLGSHIVMRLLVFVARPSQLPVRIIVDVEERGPKQTVRVGCEGATTIGGSMMLTRKFEARCQEVVNIAGPALQRELDSPVPA